MQINPIGIIHSGYKEKFGIPRQPGLAKSMLSKLELYPDYATEEIVRGLEECSHIWLVFIFSACVGKGWHPTVRPPRLGGNKRLGVFATRSPFRPNPIGLSAVKLEKIETHKGKVSLLLSGADLLDQTPIIDIKPYIPYSDSISDAYCHFAEAFTPLSLPINFSDTANTQCAIAAKALGIDLRNELSEILSCDPRPAYQKASDREYGIQLYDYNIRWSIVENSHIQVISIEPISA